MPSRIEVRPLHPVEWTLDLLFWPIMWALQCFKIEAVQRTHIWNNHHLKSEDVSYLDRNMMVRHGGDPRARRPWIMKVIPLFHFACFGGWKGYVVLAPKNLITEEWYPGWIAGGHAVGVSRLPIQKSVKLLVGPGECYYFGITAKGEQVALQKIGRGTLGEPSLWQMDPLR